MARVLLVNTPLLHVHTLRILFPQVSPTPLQVLSAALKQHGHQTRLLDHQGTPPSKSVLPAVVREYAPDVVGFSCTAMVDAEAVRELIRRTRRDHPHLRLVAGGQVPTFLPEFFLGPDGADAVVCYEGEESFPELVGRLAEGRSFEDVRGLAYLDDSGRVVRTPERPPIEDLDALPFPDREGSLHRSQHTDGLMACVETMRGCPHGCVFCSIPAFFRRPTRQKSPARVLEELVDVRRLGVTEVFFTDDCFAVDVRQATAIAEGMIALNLGIRFGIQIRADVIAAHPEMVRTLRRAGLFWVVVGFEAYRSSTLKGVNKGSSVEVNRTAARLLKEEGIAVFGTHILGAPGSGVMDLLTTLHHGRRFSDIFRMTIYTPLLGSSLYNRLQAEGRIRARSLRDFSYGTYVIRDGRSPLATSSLFYAALLGHYFAPSTLWSCVADPNPVVRRLQRNAFAGAFRFVIGATVGRLVRPGD